MRRDCTQGEQREMKRKGVRETAYYGIVLRDCGITSLGQAVNVQVFLAV